MTHLCCVGKRSSMFVLAFPNFYKFERVSLVISESSHVVFSATCLTHVRCEPNLKTNIVPKPICFMFVGA